MSSSSAKAALIPIVLGATWAAAQADDFVVKVTPSSGYTLDNVQIFSANTVTSNAGTTTQSDQDLTSNLGTVTGGTTLSHTISTSYGTSSSLFEGSDATFGLLATSNGFAVLGGAGASGVTTNYDELYGSTGVSQSDALAGILSGSLSTASALFPNQTGNAIYTASDTGLVTGTLFRFDTDGTATEIGSWSVAPVPEPASMAALGVGALALMRRRRKLS